MVSITVKPPAAGKVKKPSAAASRVKPLGRLFIEADPAADSGDAQHRLRSPALQAQGGGAGAAMQEEQPCARSLELPGDLLLPPLDRHRPGAPTQRMRRRRVELRPKLGDGGLRKAAYRGG